MVNKKGTALLMVFVDIDTEQDADFNDWYNQEQCSGSSGPPRLPERRQI